MGSFSWEGARALLVAARAGSLSAAARALRVDQSTLSRRLAALEGETGARLLERLPTGVLPTAAGARLLARAEEMEGAALAAERELRGLSEGVEGSVRLTAPEVLGSRFLARRLGAFLERHPRLSLELRTHNRVLSLSRREADVALRLAPPGGSSLVARSAGLVATSLYASRSYVAARGRPGPSRLAGHAFVGFDDTFRPEPEVGWLARHGAGAFVAMRCNSSASQAEAAASGAGVALLPCYLAAEYPELVPLLAPHELLARKLWVVAHPDVRRAAAVRALVDYLVETLRAHAPLLAGALAPGRRAGA